MRNKHLLLPALAAVERVVLRVNALEATGGECVTAGALTGNAGL